MKKRFSAFTLFLCLCLALPAFAGSIKEYSADMVNVKSGRVTSKISVTPDKIYSESFDASGKREAISIVRLDQKKIFVFIEKTKSYMEIPFNKDSFTAADLTMGMVQTKREKVGSEKVSDYTSDKFKTTASVMGMNVTAFEWIAPEFDPMPIRTESQGITLEMRNIKTGSPDSALFENPKGYKRDTQMEQMMKGLMSGK